MTGVTMIVRERHRDPIRVEWEWRTRYTDRCDIYHVTHWVEWDSWRGVLRFRFPPNVNDTTLPEGSRHQCYFDVDSLATAREMVSTASRGVLVWANGELVS